MEGLHTTKNMGSANLVSTKLFMTFFPLNNSNHSSGQLASLKENHLILYLAKKARVLKSATKFAKSTVCTVFTSLGQDYRKDVIITNQPP
jgi:hypothetical protein